MSHSRGELQLMLEELLGSENVYFQPPPNVQMRYDCIRYELDDIQPEYADNQPYQLYTLYKVTLIYRDPDSELPRKLASLPLCRHNRHYTAENLNHDVFSLYW